MNNVVPQHIKSIRYYQQLIYKAFKQYYTVSGKH